MVQGPQRKGFPNKVVTPHGQEFGRQSDHGVHPRCRPHRAGGGQACSPPAPGSISTMRCSPKYGAPKTSRSTAHGRRKEGREGDGQAPRREQDISISVSMAPVISQEAEKRRTRESGRGIGYWCSPSDRIEEMTRGFL